MEPQETKTAIANREAPSVINDMARRYGMDRKAFEATLKATVVPANVSTEQFVAFLLVAKQYNLNPITKEIFAFPARNGGIQPIVGVDGWCNIINSHPQCNGFTFEDKLDAEGKLIAVTCRIHRKDREHPIETTEYMAECKRDTDTWKKWPARRLRHKALIQAARYAFGFSGLVDPDEAERAIEQGPDNKPYDVDITKPKSPFKNNTLRKDFQMQVEREYEACQNAKELVIAKETRQTTLDALALSGDERDGMVLQSLDNKYDLILGRVMGEDNSEEDDTPPYVKQQMEEENERLAAVSK